MLVVAAKLSAVTHKSDNVNESRVNFPSLSPRGSVIAQSVSPSAHGTVYNSGEN